MSEIEIAQTIEALARALNALESVTDSCVQRRALLDSILELNKGLKAKAKVSE